VSITVPVADVTTDKPACVKTARGFEIAVFRHGNEFFALGNRCPHAGAAMQLGSCDGEVAVCPMHHFKYDLRTGRCRFPKHLRLPVFPIAIEGETLVIDASKAPAAPAPVDDD
jgi:naphthalene 1,2-dioxygenase system ferredoxin subunit